MKSPNETPEQKAERLERHKKYLEFILRKFFKKAQSQVFGGADYLDCKVCQETFYNDEEATAHYFANHWTPKNPQAT
jgi:hypothetical protein